MTEDHEPGWSPTPEEIKHNREAYRKLLADAGWPTEYADPSPQSPIIVYGEYGWVSGPC